MSGLTTLTSYGTEVAVRVLESLEQIEPARVQYDFRCTSNLPTVRDDLYLLDTPNAIIHNLGVANETMDSLIGLLNDDIFEADMVPTCPHSPAVRAQPHDVRAPGKQGYLRGSWRGLDRLVHCSVASR
jgi:hypothetical protein